uniref:EF-hand domain-containing protein n=1 Tax=Tetranychus urticae TaxID=32264 RepID=T1KIN2_TETUR
MADQMDGRTNDYEKTFASYDKDGDGTISYNEFGAVMKGLGKNLLFKSFSDRNNLDRQDRSVPIYLNSMVVISVSIAVILVVIVCAIAYVYLNLEEKKAVLQRTGYLSASPSKNFQYISTASTPSHSQPVVSEEGSLTLRYTDSSDRGSYAQKTHNYPTASTSSIHQPSTSSNVFCEADVHCANGDTRSVNFFAFQA